MNADALHNMQKRSPILRPKAHDTIGCGSLAECKTVKEHTQHRRHVADKPTDLPDSEASCDYSEKPLTCPDYVPRRCGGHAEQQPRLRRCRRCVPR